MPLKAQRAQAGNAAKSTRSIPPIRCHGGRTPAYPLIAPAEYVLIYRVLSEANATHILSVTSRDAVVGSFAGFLRDGGPHGARWSEGRPGEGGHRLVPDPAVGIFLAGQSAGQRRMHPLALAEGRRLIQRRADQRMPEGDPGASDLNQ